MKEDGFIKGSALRYRGVTYYADGLDSHEDAIVAILDEGILPQKYVDLLHTIELRIENLTLELLKEIGIQYGYVLWDDKFYTIEESNNMIDTYMRRYGHYPPSDSRTLPKEI